MCEDITDERNDRANCSLAADTVSRPVHLDEECDGGQCSYGPANRREDQMLDAERDENIAARHHEKASEPRPTKLFNGRTDKPTRAQIIECASTEVMGCHLLALYCSLLLQRICRCAIPGKKRQ